MAKENFSGGLNSLLGEPQKEERRWSRQNQKHQRKKLLRLRN
jgi:hypothetical protein